LAAALLLEPHFPALPEGLERLLDRDHARRAARQFVEARQREVGLLTSGAGRKPSSRESSNSRLKRPPGPSRLSYPMDRLRSRSLQGFPSNLACLTVAFDNEHQLLERTLSRRPRAGEGAAVAEESEPHSLALRFRTNPCGPGVFAENSDSISQISMCGISPSCQSVDSLPFSSRPVRCQSLSSDINRMQHRSLFAKCHCCVPKTNNSRIVLLPNELCLIL
jgi:hypothetical protein